MIHVIGAGGTGGWLIPALIKMADAGNITVWDGDKVEEKNLLRQNFTDAEVGMKKAEAMGSFYNLFEANCKYLEMADLYHIKNNDVVIICVDNYDTRAMLDEHCAGLESITLINAGNEATTTSTQIYVKREGVEYTPRISYMHPEIRHGKTAAQLACADIAVLPGGEQTVAANILSASLILMALVQVSKWDNNPIRIENRPFIWHEFLTDMMRGTAEAVDWRVDGIGDWRTDPF